MDDPVLRIAFEHVADAFRHALCKKVRSEAVGERLGVFPRHGREIRPDYVRAQLVGIEALDDFFGDELGNPVIMLGYRETVFEVFFVIVPGEDAGGLEVDEFFYALAVPGRFRDVPASNYVGFPSVWLVVFAKRNAGHRGQMHDGVGPAFFDEPRYAFLVSDVHLLAVRIDGVGEDVAASFSEPTGASGDQDFS